MSAPPPGLTSHHLGGGRVLAWTVLLIAALAAVQALLTGADLREKAIGVLAPLAVGCACVVLGTRPSVVELPTELEVRNPLRTAHLPWASITDVEVDDVVRVIAGDLVVRCYALPRRDRRPLTSGMASAFGGATLPDGQPRRAGVVTTDVVEALRGRAASLGVATRTGSAMPTIDVDRVALGVLLVGVVSAAAAVVLALAG